MKTISLFLSVCVAFGSAYAQTSADGKQPAKADTLKKELKEVTVEAKNIVTTPDKMMIFVDKSVKNHSYDGYSALALLNVPGLSVDATDGKISALTGNVLLCINGMEATHNEIKTLNPKDIIRIDYYTNFDPRHPDQKNVLDYIMKIRDYGGMVMLQSTQSLNIANGVEVADWKMFKKKAEFGVNVVYNYMHFKQNTGNIKSRAMMFDDGEVTRSAYSLPTRNHNNSYDITLSYIQRFKNSTLKTAVSMSPSYSKGNGGSRVEYTGLTEQESVAIDDNSRDQLVPSFTMRYDLPIKRGERYGSLNAFLGGSYFNTDVTRKYYGLETIDSRTKGHGHSINPGVYLSLPFGKIFTPYVTAFYLYTDTKSRYLENNSIASNYYSSQSSGLALGTNVNLNRKISLSLSLYENLTVENPGTGSRSKFAFTPSMNFSYEIPKYGNLFLLANMAHSTPGSGYSNIIERQKDEFLVTTGNPDLKSSYIYNLVLSHTITRKWGWIQFFSNYNNVSNAIYSDYICDNEREVFVLSYKNGGNYEKFLFNVGVNYNVIPNMFNVQVGVSYDYTAARSYRFQRLNVMRSLVRANFFKNGFVGKMELRTPQRSLSQSGEITKNPVSLNLDFGYNYKGWSFNFTTRNPFMKTHSEVMLNQPGIAIYNRKYNPKLSYDYYAIRVTFRFNYGKPHNFDSVGVDSALKNYNVGE